MRLSSIEAREINDEFIKTAADCEHLCPHFHPALQSGSDSVLRRMRRRYNTSHFLDTIQALRDRLDRPTFTTDVIVGFPGETEAEFEDTVAICREVRFSRIHVFPFSPRQGTPAAELPDQVPPKIRKERLHRIESLQSELAAKLHASMVGNTLEVLVERTAINQPGTVRGTDRRYLPITLPGDESDVGQLVNVHAVSSDKSGVQGIRS
jgi:threonylcarbamoyladenosine tRNA methylthiotransferase MtaB